MIAAAFRLIAAAILIVGSAGLAVAQPSGAPLDDRREATQDPVKPADIEDRSSADDAAVDPAVPDPPPRRRPVVPRPVFRLFVHVDAIEMSAAQTFDAVVGRSRFIMPGGGIEALHLWRGLFARGAFSMGKETGSRVAVTSDGDVLDLGIPLTIELRPIEIAGGWRWRSSRRSRFSPYLGGGLLLLTYRETSAFAGDDDDTGKTFPGALAFGGVEAMIGRGVVVGVEGQFRSVKDALGAGGVSAEFEETDLGGLTLRVLVGFRR